MKVNLKTTNDENAAETPICHQRGQMTVNGIIGNTKRGIVVDKTLDPDSNNPVANKPVSTALAALAGQLEKGQVVFLDQLPESGEPHKVYVLTATNQRYWWNDSAFVKIVPTDIKDSTTIKHTLADNKISLDLDETIKGKINAALQKPSGLTKTELVGVGANGQENIEIGDNLTLANGKLSASGGGGSSDINVLQLNDDGESYSGTLDINKLNVLKAPYINTPVVAINDHGVYGYYIDFSVEGNEGLTLYVETLGDGQLGRESFNLQLLNYSHFITMKNSANNIALYLTIQNADKTAFTAETLARYFADKKVLANGNLHGLVPTYIAGEFGIIRVYYMTPGDSNINPTPDEYQDLSSFTITDLVSPVY